MKKEPPFVLRPWFVFCLIVIAATASAAPAYHTIKRISIPGDGGWDYISADSAARRLYVPHGTEVVVIDLDSSSIVGKISGLEDAHGVAVAPNSTVALPMLPIQDR